MSWHHHRRILARFAGNDAPMARAGRAALARVEALEVLAQELLDELRSCADEDTPLMRRADRLLAGVARKDHHAADRD